MSYSTKWKEVKEVCGYDNPGLAIRWPTSRNALASGWPNSKIKKSDAIPEGTEDNY